MSSKRIKGITIDFDGNFTSLDKATEAYNKRLKSTQQQLNDVEKLLKLDPTNTELLAQKQKLLGDKIKITSESLKTLRTAQQQAEPKLKNYDAWQAKIAPINQKIQETDDSLRTMQAEQRKLADSGDVGSERYNELSEKIKDARKELKTLKDTQKTVSDEFGNPISQEQFDALRREIIKTEQELSGLNKKAEETESAFRAAGQKAADGVEDITDEAKDAAEAVEDIKKEAGGVSDAFKTGVAVAGIQEITGALKNAVEATREYRTDMAKLETAYTSNHHSTETAKKTYDELYAILGDSGQAVEAANHLALLTENQEDLSKWTEIAAGVYGTFGASLPIENLTEAANETAKTGQITGGLADALNWAGIKEGEFQARLDKCSSTSERATLITNTLSKAYDGAAKSFRTTNADMIASNKASGKLQDAMAKLGKKVEPILTALTKASANLLGILADGGPIVTGLIVAMATSKVISFAKALDLAAAKQKILNLVQSASPMGLVIGGIVGITAALISYASSSKEATQSTRVFNEELEVIETAADKAAKAVVDQARIIADEVESRFSDVIKQAEEVGTAFAEMQSQTEEELAQSQSVYDHIQTLTNELLTLAGANGEVEEASRGRASFIINELNRYMGTEYELVDGAILRYNELRDSIYETIEAKRAETLLSAYEDDYRAALENRKTTIEAVGGAQELYNARLEHYNSLQAEIARQEAFDPDAVDPNLYVKSDNARTELAEAELAYLKSVDNLQKYEATIQKYEGGMTKLLEKDYQGAQDILNDTTTLLTQKERKLVSSWNETMNEYRQDWQDALEQGDYGAARYQKTYTDVLEGLNGVYRSALGFGENIADGMANGVNDGAEELQNAVTDLISQGVEAAEEKLSEAYDIGANIAAGMALGIKENAGGAVYEAKNLMLGALGGMKTAAQIKSPSRATRLYGRNLVAGLPLGMKDGEQQAFESARTTMKKMLSSIQNVDTSSIMKNRFASESMLQSPNHVANTYNRSVSVGGVSVQVNAPNVTDVSQLADMVADRINDAILDKTAVYA